MFNNPIPMRRWSIGVLQISLNISERPPSKTLFLPLKRYMAEPFLGTLFFQRAAYLITG